MKNIFLSEELIFRYPDHESQVAQIARKVGISNISLSHQLMPMIKAVPRGFTGDLKKNYFSKNTTFFK